MAKPPKKKSTPKKAAKKPTAGKPAAGKAKPAKKTDVKAAVPMPRAQAALPADDRRGTTPYTPKPIDGIGWPAFRYPL